MDSNVIFEAEHFTVERQPQPLVCRTEGGHIKIFPKNRNISERRDLSPKEAVEFIKLSILAGEALQLAMNEQGVPVVKINYADSGNWAYKEHERPTLHLHIMGRASDAIIQKYPEALYFPDYGTGFYDAFQPLTDDDMTKVKKHIIDLLAQPTFTDPVWS